MPGKAKRYQPFGHDLAESGAAASPLKSPGGIEAGRAQDLGPAVLIEAAGPAADGEYESVDFWC